MRAQILIAIDDHWNRYRFAPTLQTIATLLGVSKADVHFHVGVLKEQGRVDYIPHLVRTLRIRNLVGSFTRGK